MDDLSDRFLDDRGEKLGQPPGTLTHVGERRMEETRITTLSYGPGGTEEREHDDIEEALQRTGERGVTWINVDGLHETEVVEALGDHFNVHPLVREDILNTDARPKMEDFDDHIFVVLKMVDYDPGEGEIVVEQVSLLLFEGVVVSFQEVEGDVFDRVRERIRTGKGRIRGAGADYLLYALIDAVVDNYFRVLEHLGDEVEDIEEGLVEDPVPGTLQDIQRMKRELILLRKAVWPLRDAISWLERTDSLLVREPTRLYFRDVYDHTVQVIDIVETFRDMLGGTLDVYMSSVSNRMNEVMKVLTVVATVFIPLTFIAGVYGMNFAPSASPWSMPELNHPYGYPAVLLLMLGIGLGMLGYFRRKGWL